MRVASLLLVLAPMTVGAQERPVEPEPAPATEPQVFTIETALRAGLQWIVDPPRAKHDVFGFGALDVLITVRPMPRVTLFADLEAVGGPGPDAALGTLSRLNAESERLEGRDGRVFLREGWVSLDLFDGMLRLHGGKLDVPKFYDRNLFAEDEARQFLVNAFVNNPVLAPPPNGPGVNAQLVLGKWRSTVGVHALEEIDGDLSGLPFIAGEIGRGEVFAAPGNYRWWARVSAVADRRDDVTWGTGISVDQVVVADTGIFLRAGLSRTEGESLTSHAVSVGVQHTPTWIGRSKDTIGFAYGFQRRVEGGEHIAETYYHANVRDCCALVANVEWIFKGPNGVSGGRNRDVIVPGLRALIQF
jgi:hypothetical protein